MQENSVPYIPIGPEERGVAANPIQSKTTLRVLLLHYTYPHLYSHVVSA
jgi:hypothetical protein